MSSAGVLFLFFFLFVGHCNQAEKERVALCREVQTLLRIPAALLTA